MANQSVGTPRFYIDYTQLAKVKGFMVDIGGSATGLSDNADPRNLEVWNFDYANAKRYNMVTSEVGSAIRYCQFRLHFWDPYQHATQMDIEWAKLMSTTNWSGIINHNLETSFPTDNNFDKKFKHWSWGGGRDLAGNSEDNSRQMENISESENHNPIDKDGFSITLGEIDSSHLANNPHWYSSIWFEIWLVEQASLFANEPFDIGAIAFGKYIDMPNSPDLQVKKSVEYDGIKIQRSLGGADYVQINNSGQPDWANGQPWTLSDAQTFKRGRIGKNGRRSWDMKFSYISNDNLFYDHTETNVSGVGTYSDGVLTDFTSTSEIQQLYDLTLGGALSFIFTPDKDATNKEYAVCRLDQDSLVATQVAHQTWDVSMRVVEVW